MTEPVFRGPAYAAGSIMDGRIEGASDGPGLEYQANAFPDIRYFPTRKDGIGPGRVPAFLNSPFVVAVGVLPPPSATASIAALAHLATPGAPAFTPLPPRRSGTNRPLLVPRAA